MSQQQNKGGGGRKRKRQQQDREKLQQYGVDLPDIPGMAVQVIPLHVFALRKAGIFFRKNATESAIQPFWIDDDDESSQTNEAAASSHESAAAARGDDSNVVTNLLQRVDRAAATETRNTDAERERNTRLTEYRNAVKSWLEALRREMKDYKSSSVLFAAMEHLWEFLMDDKEKISIRRTCLHLGGHLIEKSADVRRWFLEESNRLGKWTDMVVNTQKEQQLAYQLFQREGFMLLQHLESMGYSELYPRLRVALQRLQQQFPWIEQDVSSEVMAAASLAQLRQIRDLALLHWDKERDIVRRILDRSDACMRILVPRFGQNPPEVDEAKPAPSTDKKTNEIASDEDEEDEDIDWEDGFADEEEDDRGEMDTTGVEEPEESHADAVERTLAVMQSSARMRAGHLEINFDSTTEEPTTVTPRMVQAREKLEKFVRKLRRRHVERLNKWVDALTRADNLTEGEGGSLVQMTADARQKRRDILQNALQLKADISSCLSSAQRLVVAPSQSAEVETTQARPQPRPPASLNFHSPAPRNERLATVLDRRRNRSVDHTRKRSARIRIKYSK